MAGKTNKLIVITGPTAVGKTRLAVAVAHALDGEIINADSRQVYRQMDIGTGKDLQDYHIAGRQIPYHLIDIKEPGEQYNIKEYQRDFEQVYKQVVAAGKQPVLCGGSGLYIESVLEGNPFAFVPVNEPLRQQLADESKARLMSMISPALTEQLNITSRTTTKRLIRAVEINRYLQTHKLPAKRTERLPADIFVVTLPRQQVMARIRQRLEERLQNGLIEEVENLLATGLQPEQLLYYGLEYRWVTLYVLGEIDYDYMVERLNIAIRQFAKRQMTWFRRMAKKGYDLNWLDAATGQEAMLREVLQKTGHKKSRN